MDHVTINEDSRLAAEALRDVPDFWRRDAGLSGCTLSKKAEDEALPYEKLAARLESGEYTIVRRKADHAVGHGRLPI